MFLCFWNISGHMKDGMALNATTDETFIPNRPFASSPKSLLQSESKCEIFVMIISSDFNMNEN